MKIKSLFAVALAAFATSFVSADQGDILITFSTPGIDKYADGTTVKDGEWYAVCWAKDGAFDGLTTDCKAIGADEEVILAAPLAKDGKCPLVAFEFARKAAYSAGKFSVFMLDTRNATGAVAARGANGLPVFVKGEAVASVSENNAAAMEIAQAQATTVGGSTGAWGQVALQAETVPAKITAFEVVGANVQMTVEGLVPGNVAVKTGESVDALENFTMQVSSGDTATFIIPKEKGKFFSVVSLPAAK